MNAYKLLIGLVILLTRGWSDDRTDPAASTSSSSSSSSSTSSSSSATHLPPPPPTATSSFTSPSPPPSPPSSPKHASRSHIPDQEQMMMTSFDEEEEDEEDDDEEEEEEEEDYGSPAESGGGEEAGEEEGRGGRRRRSRYEEEPEEEEHEEEPYFDASMSPEYVAYLGKTATLTCIVHAARSAKTVTWIRSRDLRILTVGRYTYTSDLRFEALHQEGSSQWTLRIRSVQLRDVGTYECQITTKPIKTFRVFLKVVEPSVEILGAPDLYVNRASMINLTCVVYHAPVPPASIEWHHDNKSISYTSPRGGVSVVEERGETTSSFLLLQNARPADSGTFTCRPRGFQTTSINLHVLDGEHPAAMQTNSSTAGATTRSLVVFLVLTCVVATVNVL